MEDFLHGSWCSSPHFTYLKWVTGLRYPGPQDAIVTNEGLGWDFLLKMVHNPGGDWNPGWGVVPRNG